MKVIEVRAKSTRGLRKVYIILSEWMNKACLHLLNTKLHAGINPLNPYLFVKSERSPLDGCQAMLVMCERCDRLRQKSWYPRSVWCVAARKLVRRQSWDLSAI